MISYSFIILASIFNAVMDILQYKYSQSVFNNLSNKWWNPKISWKNKYKNGLKEQGPAFVGSTTIFVFITDAWHFFKTLMIMSFIFSVIFYTPITNHFIFDFIFLFSIFSIVFEIWYSFVLIEIKKS